MAATKPKFRVRQYALGDIHIERLDTEDNHPAGVYAAGRGSQAPIDETPPVTAATAQSETPIETGSGSVMPDAHKDEILTAYLTDDSDLKIPPKTNLAGTASAQFDKAERAHLPGSIEAQLDQLSERLDRLEECLNDLMVFLNYSAPPPLLGEASAVVGSDESPVVDDTVEVEDEPEPVTIPVVLVPASEELIEADETPVETVDEQDSVAGPEPAETETSPPETTETTPSSEEEIVAQAAGVVAVNNTVEGGQRGGVFRRKFAALREKLARITRKKYVRRALATIALAGVLAAGIFYGTRDDEADTPSTKPAVTSYEPAPTTTTLIPVADDETQPEPTYYQEFQQEIYIDGQCYEVNFNNPSHSINQSTDETVIICGDTEDTIIKQTAIPSLEINKQPPTQVEPDDPVPQPTPKKSPEPDSNHTQSESVDIDW